MSATTLSRLDHSPRAALWWTVGVGLVSVALIALDRITGPYVRVSIGFVFPVAVVAWRWSFSAGVWLGLALAASRVGLVLLSDSPWLALAELVNFALYLPVFLLVAWAARRLRRAPALSVDAEELLPVCGGCGRVRESSGRWRRFESVVSSVDSARFTHTVCPECESVHAVNSER